MQTDFGHFYHKLVWIAEIILAERGASPVKRIKSRLRSSMSNQMLEELLQISINGPPVSEAEDLVKEAVKTWSKAKKRRKLPPAVNLGATVQPLAIPKFHFKSFLSTLLFKLFWRQTSMKKQKQQAEVEAAVEAFKLPAGQTSYESDDSAFESEEEY